MHASSTRLELQTPYLYATLTIRTLFAISRESTLFRLTLSVSARNRPLSRLDGLSSAPARFACSNTDTVPKHKTFQIINQHSPLDDRWAPAMIYREIFVYWITTLGFATPPARCRFSARWRKQEPALQGCAAAVGPVGKFEIPYDPTTPAHDIKEEAHQVWWNAAIMFEMRSGGMDMRWLYLKEHKSDNIYPQRRYSCDHCHVRIGNLN